MNNLILCTYFYAFELIHIILITILTILFINIVKYFFGTLITVKRVHRFYIKIYKMIFF